MTSSAWYKARIAMAMVLLDVVCNHFGPEGNYLHTYDPISLLSDILHLEVQRSIRWR